MAGVGIRKFADKWLKSTLVLRYKVAFVNICKKQKAKKKKIQRITAFAFGTTQKRIHLPTVGRKGPAANRKINKLEVR